MPTDFHVLSRSDLAFALSRAFARRRSRLKNLQADLDRTAFQIVGEVLADALLADGFEVRHPVSARHSAAPCPAYDNVPATEHPEGA